MVHRLIVQNTNDMPALLIRRSEDLYQTVDVYAQDGCVRITVIDGLRRKMLASSSI